ncbi:MAG: magnesium chelatase, partial [Gordonia sp. (in: high G+C Gram-positive bacteria)]
RGRIITPLKDRFGAEIRTHYPLELDDEIAVIEQEADLTATVPTFLTEILARFTRYARDHPSIDQRSGVSARFSIAGAETVAAAALHRSAVTGEEMPVARVVDLESVIDVLRGKIEFESGEEGRELEILAHLLRKSTADTVRAHLGGIDLAPLVSALEESEPVVTGDRITAARFLDSLPSAERVGSVVADIARRLDATSDGERASAVELALEGLFLARRIGKEADETGQTIYG